MSPEISNAAQACAPIHWEKFQKELEDKITSSFVGSKDPTKAAEFFAEMKATRTVVFYLLEECKKKHQNNS